ncbi:MAG: metal ABC transporter permease, partial [Pseudogulbenkiania sp.]|nr:metal ABC transporter permease [Pseudogulbenkiania sp.]
TARLWVPSIGRMLAFSVVLAFACGIGGLLLSYHFELPSGPAIILLAGLFYLLSLFVAPLGGALPRYIRARHLES